MKKLQQIILFFIIVLGLCTNVNAQWNDSSTSVKNDDNIPQTAVVLVGHVCANNSTMTTLTGDATFDGDWQDTKNYGTVTVGVKSDKASATDGLVIQWSADGTTVHDTDTFSILADAGKVFTFGPARRYIKVVYTNGSDTQGVFSLETTLRSAYIKPSSHRINDNIVAEDDAELVKAVNTGEDPSGTFRNVGVSIQGALRNSIEDGQTGRRAEVEPLGALKTVIPVRLVGTTFSNGTKDPNFWEETVTGSGDVTQSGEIILSTGETADSTAMYSTTEKARKITGTTNQFRLVGRQQQVASADCIRRAGAYDTNNGFFFQYNGATFQVVSRNNAVDTAISNGSFNGNAGATISSDETEFTRLTIDYTALSAKFFVNGVLIHTISAENASLTNTLNLPVTLEIINENGNTIDNAFEVLFATILRLGELATAPISVYQSGTTTGEVFKYNSGALRGAIISGVVNNSVITLYDNTAASGTILWSSGTMGSQTQPFELDFKSLPFSTGLTLVISGANSNITIIYE